MMSMCRVFSCVVGRRCLLWPMCSLCRTLLAFPLLHSVLQVQICLLLQVFLDPTFAFQSPIMKRTFWGDVSSKRSCRDSVKLSHPMWGHPRWRGHSREVWQNMVHWRKEWQTTSVFLPWEPHEQMKRQNNRILKEELPRSVGAQYSTGDQWRNNSRKNEGMEPKQK